MAAIAAATVTMTGIRRKVAAQRRNAPAAADDGPGAASGWPLALARAARTRLSLDLTATATPLRHATLAEVLETIPDQAFLAMVEGPGESLGVLALSPPVLAGLIERQTLGRVTALASAPRRPTRTDAAMVAGLVDDALAGLEAAVDGTADAAWASGFRYASFLAEARPLALLLEDAAYRVVTLQAVLEGGVKSGAVMLALPAAGQSAVAEPAADPARAAEALVFQTALGDQVQAAAAPLDAVIARVSLPLALVMALAPGEVLRIGMASLDQIDLEGLDGLRVAGGRLGQNRGMRALRLTDTAEPVARDTGRLVDGVATVETVLRRTGTG